MREPHSLRIRAGEPLRIEGQRFLAGPVVEGGRIFVHQETGKEKLYDNAAQIRMARDGRITTEAMWKSLSAGVREAVATDWDAFSPGERERAQWRMRFVRKLDELPARNRRKKACMQTKIDEVCAEHPSAFGKPSVRMVRTWDTAYHAAGRDIRALVDLSYRKGRRDQLPKWIREEVDRAIDQVYATQPPGSLAETRRRAVSLIRERAAREGRNIPDRGQGEGRVVGINVVAKALASRDRYDILVRREGRAEADRLMSAVEIGPQGEYPLSAVEIDHTLLDIIVVDEASKTILGRPWLTVLLDRYSRCIVGFSMSFHPPSWTTVMEALRIGVADKQTLLDEIGGISNAWPCHGVPDELVCDNGKEFHSSSMQETEAALNMRILYLPRRKGWLKGKVERWFRKLEEQIFHQISGTTLSNVVKRGDYDSEGCAVLSMRQAQWLVAKWVVDVYHQEVHSATDEAPVERWTKGMRLCGEKLPPPPGLLVPMTGMVIPAKLGREGIKFECLRWNSNAFSALRNRIGLDETVLVRIDPLDLRHAYAFDAKRRKWIEGDLLTTGIEDGLTLHQYRVVRERARLTQEPGEDRLAAISRARSEIFAFVQSILTDTRKSKAGKRFARFAADGRKPSEHIAASRVDPTASARRIGSRDIDRRKQEPKRVAVHTAPASAAASAAQTGPIVPLTVRRRRTP